MESHHELVKKEVGTKNEQLKQKNKKIESMQKNLDKTTEEKDSSQTNFLNKIIKLEKNNANLREDLEKSKLVTKNKEKEENKELKTLKKEYEKKKMSIQKLKTELENVKEELLKVEMLKPSMAIKSQTPSALLQPTLLEYSSPTTKQNPTTIQPKTISIQPAAPNSQPTPSVPPTLETDARPLTKMKVTSEELVILIQNAWRKQDEPTEAENEEIDKKEDATNLKKFDG